MERRLTQAEVRQDSPKTSFGAATLRGAGLSHVTKEFEKEGIVPSGALELEPQESCCIGVSSSDIEGKTSEYGKVGRGVVLAIAGQILVEDDVERPMQAVFDGPMSTDDPQNILGTVGLAHQKEALDGLVFAALAGDPGNGLDPGKVVLLRHVLDRRDKGSALSLRP